MKILVTKLTDRNVVKRAMLTTQGKKAKTDSMSDNTLEVQLFGLHSTLEYYIFEIEIDGCTEREHTHIVRHEEIGKYVSTSRPDWSDGSAHNSRSIRLFIPANRMVQIMNQRLCGSAYSGTRKIFVEIREQIKNLDPMLFNFLTPPCSKTGYCTEVRSFCGYMGSPKQVTEYNWFRSESQRLCEGFHK